MVPQLTAEAVAENSLKRNGVSNHVKALYSKQSMKRYCKNVDIHNLEFLKLCAKDCLKKKWNRRDVNSFFQSLTEKSKEEIKTAIKEDKEYLIAIAAAYMKKSLDTYELDFVPIWYKEKIDASNNKLRRIGIQHISQQFFDYVAVYGMHDLFKRIGEYQCASIPGRGPVWGMRRIRKWLREKDVKYFAQLDIKKCFPSIPQEKLLLFLDSLIANKDIKWLVNELVHTYEEGLSIGSYLSQYLCNLYISILYHNIAEDMYYIRRGKRINLVKHQLIYMDDINLFGTSSKSLHKAVDMLIRIASDMGLTVKPKWTVQKLTGFIDTMGFRIYRDHVTIRRRIFIRTRRTYKRAQKRLTSTYAHKCISYAGQLKNTNSFNFMKKYKVYKTLRKAKEMIKNESKLRLRTA